MKTRSKNCDCNSIQPALFVLCSIVWNGAPAVSVVESVRSFCVSFSTPVTRVCPGKIFISPRQSYFVFSPTFLFGGATAPNGLKLSAFGSLFQLQLLV